jgi:mannose-6-phosphate isomerase
MVYPLKMKPYFRHGEDTPWGGSALGALFGKDIPDDRTGESLEISALPGRESVIENGPLAGLTLTAAISKWGHDLTGDVEGFPLLLKLLDAREMLSVQVHPDDTYAGANEGGKLGKTEAWLILSAQPGAKLVYGVNVEDSDALKKAVEDGKLEESLRWVNVLPGDVLYIPHGCVHALGGGLVIVENLCLKKIVGRKDVMFFALPLKYAGADGAPVRAIAEFRDFSEKEMTEE